MDGEILNVSLQGPDHRGLKDELHARLAAAYASEAVHILNQGPVRMGRHGLPEPDVAVVHGRPRDYLQRHPAGSDLVVEIAKTSQERDHLKATDYARGAVPAYWLLDLAARRLDVSTEPVPAAGRYGHVSSLGEDDTVELPRIDARWDVHSMLP